MPFDGQNFEYPVFSLEGLVQWLEGQEPETEYDYMCNGHCLIGQYFRARGVPLPATHGIGGQSWRDRDGNAHALPPGFNAVAVDHPRTNGAALQRARALLEKA